MPLTLFNGSPRRKKSNSRLLLDYFRSGYMLVKQEDVEVFYLADRDRDTTKKAFLEGDVCILIFPLYTDSMPAMVKSFFEDIFMERPLSPAKQLGFILQSGFPEAIHSVWLEPYLRKFTMRLGCQYLGTVIKPGVEGIQVMPPFMTKRLYANFMELGRHFAQTGAFSPELMAKLSRSYKRSRLNQFFFNLLPSRLINFYWNSHLKKNGAWEKRFASPYEVLKSVKR
jgi:NAD(P)H-dependent FMN reductase